MTTKFFPDFTQKEYDQIIESVERRQHNYVCGDKVYNELGNIADELKRRQASAIQFKC